MANIEPIPSTGAAVLGLAGLFYVSRAFADPAITTGSTNDALKYYRKEEILFHGLKLTNGVTPLDDVVAFLGYSLSGAKLETLDPAVLMSPQLEEANGGLGFGTNDSSGARFRNGDILASRLFAPKIVNISATNATPGWRKLVRLRSRPNSPAIKAGVEGGIILFNFLVATTEQPFTNHSFNTQVILLPAYQHSWLTRCIQVQSCQFCSSCQKPAGNPVRYFCPHLFAKNSVAVAQAVVLQFDLRQFAKFASQDNQPR